jgi:carbon storage regulator
MLVLSRKKDEEIVIGDGLIRVVVVEVRGDKVRIGIEAPKDVPVHRKEVHDAINRESQCSSTQSLNGSLCQSGQDELTG